MTMTVAMNRKDGRPVSEPGEIMSRPTFFITLTLAVVAACKGPGTARTNDTVHAPHQPADSPAAATRAPQPGTASPTKSTSSGTAGITPSEPGTVPAKPTPAVTSENAIAAMRLNLQRLDSSSVQILQSKMKDHSKSLGDLLTTMRVEAQAATSPTKSVWLAAADSVESDLDRLALSSGEELRTAFREHRTRVSRLLDGFRVLVPMKGG